MGSAEQVKDAVGNDTPAAVCVGIEREDAREKKTAFMGKQQSSGSWGWEGQEGRGDVCDLHRGRKRR